MSTPIPDLERQKLYDRARRHLQRRDPLLKGLMQRIGPCRLVPNPDHFGLLVRSIISQQISTKAANNISQKLIAGPCQGTLSAAAIVAASDEALRGVGLSASKAKSVRHLAEMVHGGQLNLAELPELDDEAVIQRLLPVRGIGRWTAEMFLIFSLGRLNVLPVDDHGLKSAVRQLYDLPTLPDRARLRQLGEVWGPYCSVATWYCWRSLSASTNDAE